MKFILAMALGLLAWLPVCGSSPRMEAFLPDSASAPTPAVVICPGGAYAGLAYEHEGVLPARWLNEQGIAAFVLSYTLPQGDWHKPVDDVLQAIASVRRDAGKWGVDPSKVGVMGFSAGGHLASTAATHFTVPAERPDFAVLVYPVITMDSAYTNAMTRDCLLGPDPAPEAVRLFSNELQVTPFTPRTFIAFCDDDDCVAPRNATLYYDALRAASVPAELHIYPRGGHGWGWLPTFPHRSEFLHSLSRFLSSL